MTRTAVLNIVGLSPSLLGSNLPRITRYAEAGRMVPVGEVLPAVTCSVQATYLTGKWPSEHGIVGNGWLFRDECEVKFWRQSNQLVQQPKLWEVARELDPEFSCANLFWWYNMNSTVDYAVTPRPMYPSDGRKIPDIYTWPPELRGQLNDELGEFPLFEFWGPNASIRSSDWIAQSAKRLELQHSPTLSLVYLPHLDYGLQKYGPEHPKMARELQDIDRVVGELLDFYAECGVQVVLLSEYGIERAWRPIHINRMFREAGMIAVREELGRELLDAGMSEAFAVADHQVAHVYVRDPQRLAEVKAMLEQLPGVGEVLDEAGKRRHHLDHDRAGDLVVVAEPGAWFTYYYWLDDDRAPDFARTVEIHKKPGYDPAELFMDPHSPAKLKAARALAKKKLGFRYLMDVIGLDATVVRGSHGRLTGDPQRGPLLISPHADLLPPGQLGPTEVFSVLLRHLQRSVAEPARELTRA
ncbi:alkaline phosphatase family protein [Deinococcus sonorensis]|uniref:Nucleotide pyrophosphatase/phosphodiesterase family protein n=1 Tax=Deinococcus sonorensis KR-87 TaxID=694439 RepID=A0AAU7UGC8_9DEIO